MGTVIPQPLDHLLREWRPQAFGRSRGPRIADPIIEPLWVGERVLLVHRRGGRPDGILEDGRTLADSAEDAGHVAPVLDAVAEAVDASFAVIDGYLTRQPAQPSEGTVVGIHEHERPGLARRLLLGDSRARQDAERRERAKQAAADLAAAGLPLVFVAVDLLALDDEPFLDVPLLERKRHLDSIVTETALVRVSPFVRAPATRWYMTWRASGFFEMALKAANSRYRPGEPNDDWAVAPIPRR